MIGLNHFLVLSAILFTIGMFIVMTRRHGIMMLMGLELILNAANLNLVAFSRFVEGSIRGQAFAIFVIILAVAEAAIALAIILSIYSNQARINLDELQALKE
ncbi:MAG: NADH-quinone oxidoreductase subunit NuoK [Candidatus Omnitrophica bacterium]|nr:MAG: NADH-quinone oxidoreductase subunit K [Candidatus Hinthialibacteria bacterium OLB16]MBE7487367.1 NADH-quinone oxidoreductase subunit NuoK [bacterium]MBK7494049.1 NADH-quinone oxidoreductase subunit NuoK [Candidatus Omnitrophota bacterium]MCE7907257.1 NADH-quinone oxidoreductase subunit NuoK [Candidatus Omnitrophica bacterium COP1]MBV6480667.1 NADH-quinone oxidoreductase subunit 11 [bacterium]